MTASGPPEGPAPGRPDGLFVLVAGLYVASVVGPLAVALAWPLVSGAGPLYVVLLVGAAGGTAVGALAVRQRAGIAERLGNSLRAWLLVATPLTAMTAVLAVAALAGDVLPGGGPLPNGALLLAIFGGFAAATLGAVLVSMAKTRYATWILDDAVAEAAWSAPWPARSRRRLRYAAGGAFVVGAATFLAGAFVDIDVLRIAGQVLVPAGAVLWTVGQSQTYRATDRGLQVETYVARRYYPWSAFTGYRLSGNALVLVRPEPYRQSIRCDVTTIDEPKAVSQALDAYLERLS